MRKSTHCTPTRVGRVNRQAKLNFQAALKASIKNVFYCTTGKHCLASDPCLNEMIRQPIFRHYRGCTDAKTVAGEVALDVLQWAAILKWEKQVSALPQIAR